jgi:hypothetical protein
MTFDDWTRGNQRAVGWIGLTLMAIVVAVAVVAFASGWMDLV